MRVAVLPGDTGGCGNYRLRWPAEAVRGIRPDWDITVYRPKGDVKVGLDRRQQVVEVQLDPLPEVMVIQRAGTPLLVGVTRWMQDRGVAVVVDYDDAMWCIARENVAWAAWNTNRRPGALRQHWRTCDETAKIADLVTVTTDGLARRYGDHGRVEVIPNGIPERALSVPNLRGEHPDTFAAGWAGYTATHPKDCAESAPAARALAEQDRKLRVIADAEGAAKEWSVAVEAIPSAEGDGYYSALSRLDLMLVGLRGTVFNNCKSYLKVLEAGSQGVPSIASATKPHRELKRSGFPVLLADSEAEWRSQALKVMSSPEYLNELRERLAEVMLAHTIEARAEEWARAWERARRRADSR